MFTNGWVYVCKTKIITMKKEVKIEDFVSKDELDAMTETEREIYDKVFLMNKQNLQGLTDALDMINKVKEKDGG